MIASFGCKSDFDRYLSMQSTKKQWIKEWRILCNKMIHGVNYSAFGGVSMLNTYGDIAVRF